MIHLWITGNSCLDHWWFTNNTLMDHWWLTSGSLIIQLWITDDSLMDNWWFVYGSLMLPSMDHLLITNGSLMIHINKSSHCYEISHLACDCCSCWDLLLVLPVTFSVSAFTSCRIASDSSIDKPVSKIIYWRNNYGSPMQKNEINLILHQF